MWTGIQCWLLTDFRDSSWHRGLCRNSPSSFTPESCRLLLPLRSSFLRWEGLDLRAEASLSQLVSDKLHHLNLNKEQAMHLMLEQTEQNTLCLFVFLKLAYDNPKCTICDMSRVKWPQNLQVTVWMLQKTTELHPWTLHVIGAQVEESEMGRVGLQSRGQKITAGHRQPAAHQS